MVGLVSIQRLGNALVQNFSDGSNSIAQPASSGVWRCTGSNNVAIRRIGKSLVAYFASGAKVVAYPGGNGIWMANSSIDVNPPPPPPPYPAAADDYPWPNDAINTLSPLRYDYRECVDFVAWRMNRDIGVTHAPWRWDWTNLSPNGNGDAIAWRGNWQANGWKVDIAPVPGAVAWYGTSAGALGHVAQVQAVSGGNVVLEEYNWGGTHNYDKRTVSQSEPDSYLQAAPK